MDPSSGNDGQYSQNRVHLIPQGRIILSSEAPNSYRVLPAPDNTPSDMPYQHPGYAGPQVYRITPRQVYNLQGADNRGNSRRGSVDSGLAHVIHLGGRGQEGGGGVGGGGTRVIRLGPVTQGDSLDRDRAPRVIRMGPGYSDSTAQVFHIGPGGGMVQGSGGGMVVQGPGGRSMQEYYAPRGGQGSPRCVPDTTRIYTPQETTSGRNFYDLSGESQPGYESPRVITITPRYPRSSSTAPVECATPDGQCYQRPPRDQSADSPRILGQGQPQVIHYRVMPQGHPLSDWQRQADQEHYPTMGRVSRVTGYPAEQVGYSVGPSYPAAQDGNFSRGYSTGQGGFQSGQVGVPDDFGRGYSQGHIGPARMGEIGKSNSTEETFFLGPNGRRRVSIQMIGVPRDSNANNAGPLCQQLKFVAGYNNDGTPQAVCTPVPATTTVLQGRATEPGEQQRLSDFDRIIGESIRQFMIQRKPYQNPNAPWRTTAAPWQNTAPQTEFVPSAPDSTSVSGSGENEEQDRNLFNKYKFQFGSIGNFNRSNSRDVGGGSGSGSDGESQGSGKLIRGGRMTPGTSGPVAIFFFNDFDDMVARMRELKEGSGTMRASPSATCDAIGQDDSSQGRNVEQGGVKGGTLCGGTGAAVASTQGSGDVEGDPGYCTLERGVREGGVGGVGPLAGGTLAPSQQQTQHSSGTQLWPREVLRQKIEVFNHNTLGLIMSLEQGSESFDGFIRVKMNLIRPVQLSETASHPAQSASDIPPPSGADIPPPPVPNFVTGASPAEVEQVTTFYLPKDTSKVIHITSTTTTKEVIKQLLAKFHIRDNPMKFALYENVTDTICEDRMRRLQDTELPLALCLSWMDNGGLESLTRHEFVLQENDTGEILWEAFSLPELENFLLILNKEADEYIKQVRTTYRLLKIQLLKRLQLLKRDDDPPSPSVAESEPRDAPPSE